MDVNAKDRKFFWLKLPKDFFKSGTMQIIESMDNGPEYVLFYIKALCESIEHDGFLLLTEHKPHTPKTLAAVLRMDVNRVKEAIDVLADFGLIKVTGEQYYMPELKEMVGRNTYWAQKKREQRERDDPDNGPV